MGSDCDVSTTRALRLSCSCDCGIHQTQPQLVSLRTRAVGVRMKYRYMLMNENADSEEEKTTLQRRARYGTYRGIQPVHTTGITGTGHVSKLGTTSMPVPETSVSSVKHQPGTGRFGKFGTTSTRYRQIVTSSPGALAPHIHARKDTHTHPQISTGVALGINRDTEHS